MRWIIPTVLLAVAVGGCSSSGDTPDAKPSPSATTPTATAEAGESVDCQLAATKWVDRINKHATDAIMGTAVIATTLNIGNLDDATSRIKVLCSDELANAALEANYEISLVNAKLRVCELSSGVCSKSESKAIIKSTDKIAILVRSVNDLMQE